MNAAGGLYPSLGRYFRTITELANAGCMSRQRARDCLDGKKEFTDAEKKAIAANILAKLLNAKHSTPVDFENAMEAWEGDFNAIYRKKVKNV